MTLATMETNEDEDMTAAATRQAAIAPPPGQAIQTIHGPRYEGAPTNPVTVALRQHRAMLESLVPKGLSVETVLWEAHWAAQANPELLKATAHSLVRATARCLQLGLTIGVTGHLVPFSNKTATGYVTECVFIADYKGLIELVVRNGVARDVEAACVYKTERFRLRKGLDPVLEHEPSLSARKANDLIGAYCIVRRGMRDTPRFEFLTLDRIEQVRAKSRRWAKGPCPEWYACKTVIRHTMKFLPQSESLRQVMMAIEEDAREEFGDDVPPFDASAEEGPSAFDNDGAPQEDPPRAFDETGFVEGNNPPPESDDDAPPAMTFDEASALAVRGRALGTHSDVRLHDIRDWARGKLQLKGGADPELQRIAIACTVLLEARDADARGFDQ